MSIYYYSGLREVFTVTLGTIAFFLFAYKFTEKNLDNTLSIVAGLAGMTIPLFPTGRPRGVHPLPSLTPLQNLIGEDWTKYIHYGASAIFIASLGGICVLFGRRERKRPEHGNVLPARFWQGWHFVCAGAIVVAAIWIVVTTWFAHGPYWSLLVGEGVSAVAFGASIVRAPTLVHGEASEVTHDGAGLLEGMPPAFMAARYHSLAVDPATLPPELRVTAMSEADRVIMGIRHITLPLEGVQFHPESVLTPRGPHLLANFLRQAGEGEASRLDDVSGSFATAGLAETP